MTVSTWPDRFDPDGFDIDRFDLAEIRYLL